MLFSCIFTQIFDFGYGSNICQFLNGDELVTMFQVNKECAETVVKYLEKKIVFKEKDNEKLEIIILNTPRYFLSSFLVKYCKFRNYISDYSQCYMVFYGHKEEVEFWCCLEKEHGLYVWIKYIEFKLRELIK